MAEHPTLSLHRAVRYVRVRVLVWCKGVLSTRAREAAWQQFGIYSRVLREASREADSFCCDI
jgi:hypothetical protein